MSQTRTRAMRRAQEDPDSETRWHGTRVRLLAGDITQVSVDAIVNAANSALRGGSGVDRAIHAAAGPSVMAELRERYDGCPIGSAVLTGAGDLPADHIIHAVGPKWDGGSHDEAPLLASAYSTSLDRASEVGARSVAFAAISCGVYGYPPKEAADVALSSVRAWHSAHRDSGIGDITQFSVDVVINAANSALAGGSGVDGVSLRRPVRSVMAGPVTVETSPFEPRAEPLVPRYCPLV